MFLSTHSICITSFGITKSSQYRGNFQLILGLISLYLAPKVCKAFSNQLVLMYGENGESFAVFWTRIFPIGFKFWTLDTELVMLFKRIKKCGLCQRRCVAGDRPQHLKAMNHPPVWTLHSVCGSRCEPSFSILLIAVMLLPHQGLSLLKAKVQINPFCVQVALDNIFYNSNRKVMNIKVSTREWATTVANMTILFFEGVWKTLDHKSRWTSKA